MEGSGSGSGCQYVAEERSRVEIVSGKGAPQLQKADWRPTAARSPKPYVMSMTTMRVSGSSQTLSHESAQSEYNNNNYYQSNSKAWRSFKDNKNPAEKKSKKRIAKYKVYIVEGKLKASLNKGLRWIKNKCSQIVLDTNFTHNF